MENYKVTIAESSAELTARERIMYKDTTNAHKMDEVVGTDSPLTITPVAYVVLNIHNEKSDNKDYPNYLVVDKDGNKYVTGSTSFWNAFKEIWDEMEKEGLIGTFDVQIYKRDSKNYKGKCFLTCSII